MSTSGTVEALHGAREATESLFDAHLPDWENPERRLDFIDKIEAIYNSLERALYEATKPQALGRVRSYRHPVWPPING